MILKLIPILAPFLILIIIRMVKMFLVSKMTAKSNIKSNEMVSCSFCNTHVHEELVIRKFGKQYCSEECSNS